MIELQNLSVGYGSDPVLQGVNLSFVPGTVTALLGPNGCGKSTLLKSIVGLSDVLAGGISIGNTSYVNLQPNQLAQQVAYLPQGRRVPDITVQRMVLHGRFPYLHYPRRYSKSDFDAAQAAMERVGIRSLAEEPLAKLSGGTRQKAYIAMALAQDTPTILLDEPTTYLDIGHQLGLLALCRDLAQQGKAVVLVLHDIAQALEYADRIAVLHGGTLAAQGSPHEILASGALTDAFGVTIYPVQTPGGRRYFCEKEG